MNQSTFTPRGERSVNAQKIAMLKEIISEHGIVRATNAANKIPKKSLADEEFKKFRTHGTAIQKPDAKQLEHTTADPKNSREATFETSQLDMIHSPQVATRSILAGCPRSRF